MKIEARQISDKFVLSINSMMGYLDIDFGWKYGLLELTKEDIAGIVDVSENGGTYKSTMKPILVVTQNKTGVQGTVDYTFDEGKIEKFTLTKEQVASIVEKAKGKNIVSVKDL